MSCSSEEVQALNLKAVLDLRVLKKPCKQEADLEEARVKRSPDSGSFMNAGSSSQELSSSEEVKSITSSPPYACKLAIRNQAGWQDGKSSPA